MGKKDQMTVTRVNKYVEMVERELEPLQKIIESARERLRLKIERELKAKLGLNKLNRKIEQLQKELSDLELQRTRVVGKAYRHDNMFYTHDSPFAKEVEARMTAADGEIAQFDLLKKESINKIWLADAPSSIAELLKDLARQVKPMIAAAQRRYKALPAPKPEELEDD